MTLDQKMESTDDAIRAAAFEHHGYLYCMDTAGPPDGTAEERDAWFRGQERGLAEYQRHCAGCTGCVACGFDDPAAAYAVKEASK